MGVVSFKTDSNTPLPFLKNASGVMLVMSLGEVAESVEREPRVREIRSSVPSQFKPMTYEIDSCHFLAWCSALIGQCD